MRESASAAHHNLIIGTLAFISLTTQGLTLIAGLISTTIIKRLAPTSFMTDMLCDSGSARMSNILNEHILTDASNVAKAHSLMDLNQHSGRLLDYKVRHIPNPNKFRKFCDNNGLYVEFDGI